MRRLVRFVVLLVLFIGLSTSGALADIPAVRAIDAGAWWHLALGEDRLRCLAIDPLTPSTLYAGAAGGGVSRSIDSGITWTSVNAGLTDLWIWSLAIDPHHPYILYAGTDSSGVFRSWDSGTTWTAVSTGLTNAHVRSLAINPLAPSTLYAGTTGGVFRSTNNGSTWTPVNTGLSNGQVSSLAINPLVPEILYAGTTGGVFRSMNGGATWTTASAGLTDPWVWSLAIDVRAPQILYAGTVGGVFRSTNGGSTWGASSTGLTDLWILCLAVDPVTSTTVYAGTASGGVSRSTNGGATWSEVADGLTDPWVWSVVVNPLTPAILYAGTGSSGVFQYDAVSAFTLTTTASPSDGGSVSVFPAGLSYARGTVVTLSAAPAAGYAFAGWSGDLIGSVNVAAVTMNADTAITALFTPETYVLTVNVSGLGSVSSDPDQASYSLGAVVRLTATPALGWAFTGWTGDVTTVMNPISLVIGGAHVVAARFEPAVPSLTSLLSASVVGQGSIERLPNRDAFDPVETVELRAVPTMGWGFTKWEGDLSGTVATAQLSMTASRHVVAVFEKLPEWKLWTVVFDNGAHGTVTPAGTQIVRDGTVLHLEIRPNAGYQVDRLLVDGKLVSLPSTAAQAYELGPIAADRIVQCTFVAMAPAPETHLVSFAIGSTWLTIDGRQTVLDAAATIQNGRTLLPIRAIVEAFGGTIAWHAELRVVDISLNGHQISLQIGSHLGWVDFAQKAIDASDSKVVPIIVSGRTFLPLRFVAESLGLQVDWNPATRTVTVQG